MIDLHLRATFEEQGPPFVVKVVRAKPPAADASQYAILTGGGAGPHSCSSPQGGFTLLVSEDDSPEGDVLLCIPAHGVAQRLFRHGSQHNTLLLTERCDQLCVMCSQPPKASNDDWRFPHYERALHLVDRDAVIGISGGEPTLYKDVLLNILGRVSEKRPDLSYHILSNGQHFVPEDRERLAELHRRVRITWGIPLYSHQAKQHDRIVGKEGAYHRVLESLYLLASTRADIELRTVITALNVLQLPHLASFIASHLPFIADWAIMGMEPIGYAKANRDALFFDHSAFPQPLVSAAQISKLLKIPCHFFNIPRCTVPPAIRGNCVDSISDWKKKFLPQCTACTERSACSGFFEWYNQKWEWSGVKPIIKGRAGT